ncbi:MAG: thiamine pyrophosphate-binding protein [Pseudomonadota bacterium]|nr:thiamine pyrophosphate-binding protein [Pseudomonadota bacterium]
MNRLNGAEAFVRMLRLYGVEVIFGLCGDTSLPLYDALARLDHGITHVLTRDERSAAYMADAYAKITGKVGVCEGPSGGGATYILPGVVEANESSIPVLAITSDISVSSRGRFTLTELDQKALFAPLTKWNEVVDRAEDIPRTLRDAFSAMTSGTPGAAHIGLPFDVQNEPVDEDEIWADEGFGRYPTTRIAPDPEHIERAAEIIGDAKAPLFICGGGVLIAGAEDELRELAERIAAPVATTISGQGSITEVHELAVGVVGSNGGVPESREVVDAADLIIFIGCRAGSVTTERWRHPEPGATQVIHIDTDPSVMGATYQTDCAIIGDAKLTLSALDACLAPKFEMPPARALNAAFIAAQKKAKFDAFHNLAESDVTPILPERIVADLQAVLPDDAIVIADPGTPCPYFSAFYEFKRSGRYFLSNRAHGALGYALPAAVGAHYGRPDAKIVAIMGDGAFGFCVGELETVVRLNIPATFVVVSNAVFGWIKAGQKTGYDARYYSVDFSRTDHAKVAEAYGVTSCRVEAPSDLKSALAEAVAHDGASLVDVIAQPLQDARAPVSEWVA